MNTESQTVPVSRIIENSLYCDGQHFKQKLMWVQDPTIAPARWLENRIDLRRNHSTEPGLYRESGQIIDTVTGQVLESYDGKFWINRESPASSPDPEPDPELSRWQKVILALFAVPGVVAGVVCLPPLFVLYLSFKTTHKLFGFFKFWQALNTPDKP